MTKLLSPAELSSIIGLAVQTIYNRISTGGSLPRHIKLNRLVKFPIEDVQIWIDTQCSSANELPHLPRKRGRPSKAESIHFKMNKHH